MRAALLSIPISCRARCCRTDRNLISVSTRHAAVRPSVELLALRASDRRPHRHAAVRLSVELLALRASDRRPRRHATVRPSVELLALRASDRRPRRHAAVRLSVELLALRASDRGLRRHALALRDDERLAGRANIWHLGRGHRTRFAPIPNAANRRPAPKSEKSAAVFRYITPLPIERPREPEMTDRRNQLGSDHTTRRPRYVTAARRRVERKRVLFCHYPTPSAVCLTGVLGMLEGDDYHRTCERRGPGCLSGLPFYVTHPIIT